MGNYKDNISVMYLIHSYINYFIRWCSVILNTFFQNQKCKSNSGEDSSENEVG